MYPIHTHTGALWFVEIVSHSQIINTCVVIRTQLFIFSPNRNPTNFNPVSEKQKSFKVERCSLAHLLIGMERVHVNMLFYNSLEYESISLKMFKFKHRTKKTPNWNEVKNKIKTDWEIFCNESTRRFFENSIFFIIWSN